MNTVINSPESKELTCVPFYRHTPWEALHRWVPCALFRYSIHLAALHHRCHRVDYSALNAFSEMLCRSRTNQLPFAFFASKYRLSKSANFEWKYFCLAFSLRCTKAENLHSRQSIHRSSAIWRRRRFPPMSFVRCRCYLRHHYTHFPTNDL